MPLSVEQAVDLIREGARFGDVAPLLSFHHHRDQLREWYVRAEGVPVNPTRPASAPAPAPARTASQIARDMGFTGDACTNPMCGKMTMVNNGTCLKCVSCGETSGCS